MRPQLKISNLTNLQDARSSAAVGFDLISFNLERGNHKKLSASLIWNMVNWLSGPGIVLEMNTISLDELQEVKQLFEWAAITLPAEEWNPMLLQYTDSLILRGDQFTDPKAIQDWVAQATAEGKQLKVCLSLPDLPAAGAYQVVAEHVFLHFTNLDLLEAFIQANDYTPFGFSVDSEAEEEPGLLDYVRIDELMDIFEERFISRSPDYDTSA